MSELRNAIERHLGISVESDSITYYQLLDVPADANTESIQRALQEAADKWNRSDRKTNPEAAKSVAALIKEAQSVLLKPDRRHAYDSKLHEDMLRAPSESALRRSNTSTAMASIKDHREIDNEREPAASNTATLAAQLDNSDLQEKVAWDAPFDVTMELPSYELRDFGTPEARWSEIVKAASMEPFLLANSGASPGMLDRSVFVSGQARSTKPGPPTPSAVAGKANAVTGKPSAASGADRVSILRKKRQRQQIVAAAGLIGTALLCLLAASIYFYNNQRKLALAQQQGEQKQTTPASATENPNDPFLPGIPPNDKGTGAATAGRPSDFRSNLPSIGMSSDNESMGNDMANSNGDEMNAADPGATEKPSQENMADLNAADRNSDMPMMTDDGKGKMMGAPESAARDPKWIEAMNQAREGIRKADFDKFRTEIEKALPLNRTEEQEKMFKRLDQLGQLYEIAVNAMKEARKSLRGTESLSVGKGKVAIVEAKEDGLILRVGGNNVTYAWDQLPPGIALAVSNFTLSETDPTDVAARAVYLSMASSTNEIQEKSIQSLWEKSLGKGSILSDLPQALLDTYEQP